MTMTFYKMISHLQQHLEPRVFSRIRSCIADSVHLFWGEGVNLAGTLILVLCEYPCFEYFDDEVFIGGEDVIVMVAVC